MTQQTPSKSPIRIFGQPKMGVLLLLGFASGLPLYLTSKNLQAWMTVEGVDLTTIGLFSLVGIPASLKFLWAPLLDRYTPPFLGRRRGWLLITQVALLVAIAAMALHDPRRGLQALAINAVLIAFFSASQDIVGDAYRTDVLEEREMGAGAATWVLGYRIAMLVVGSLAFFFADRIGWPGAYLAMAALMLIGIAATLRAPEPVMVERPPQTLYEAAWLPFREFFQRAGALQAVLMLLFVVLYKLPDNLAIGMSTPFLLQTGFTQTEIGAVAGGVGLVVTIAGSLAGGAVVARLGLNRALWVVLLLQSFSQLGYWGLALHGHNYSYMVAAVVAENFVYGMVTAVFIGYLMSLCSKRFSATQYALLSSLMAVSRDLFVAPAGRIAEMTGWPTFFMIALLSGIPALLLLPYLAPWNAASPRGAAVHTGEVRDAEGRVEAPPTEPTES